MVDVQFDNSGDDTLICEGCGTELPAFLDECPYCADDGEYEPESSGTEAPCPSCGALIYDDSERCAICGEWVSMRLASGRSGARSVFVGVVVFLLVVAILYMMVL